MKKFPTQRITRLALFTAAALILTLVENALPPLLIFAPGARMGLANAVILTALILFGPIDAVVVLVAKCLLGALFAGNPAALLYSVPAGVISFALQYLSYQFFFPKISLMSISLSGAVAHNMTQLLIASLIFGVNLFYVLPLTLIASVIAGLFVGLSAYFTVKYLPKSVFVDH